MADLTAERLREILHYDPETGVFVWLKPRRFKCLIGQAAGYKMPIGYASIMIDGKRLYAHRLAWLYMTGAWPEAQIDHRNGVRDDNRFANLRAATKAENMQNSRLRKDNQCGFQGVRWDEQRRKWQARIRYQHRKYDLGRFATPEDAHAAYLAAKAKLHAFAPVPREG